MAGGFFSCLPRQRNERLKGEKNGRGKTLEGKPELLGLLAEEGW